MSSLLRIHDPGALDNLLWTPNMVATVGWYDAADASTITESAGQVTVWADKSGNGYDMLQTGGTPQWGLGEQINGMNVMHYQGTTDQLGVVTADIDLTEFCILGVGESLAAGDWPAMGYIRSTAGDDTLDCRLSCNATDGKMAHAFMIDNAAGGLNSSRATDLADDNPFVLASWYDGDNFTGRVNGGTLSQTVAALDEGTFTINLIQCGRQSNTPRNSQAEYIILPTSDIATIEKAEGYLAWKWGLVANLEAGHPYKSAAPILPV